MGVADIADVAHPHAVARELVLDHVLVELKPAHAQRFHDLVGAITGVDHDRIGTADDQKATLAVYPVRRSDTLAVMHFTVAVDPNADDGIFVFDLFGDADSTTGDASSSTSVDGVRLVDSVRRKVYLPASDGKGNCLCSRDLKGDLEPGHTYTFYATYAAPPAEVSVLDVSFPQFGTVSRVPVQ